MTGALELLKPYAVDAPLGTFCLAALTVGVAFWSLNSTKKIARGRGAVDFFLKTEMDPAMLKAFEEYRAAIGVFQQSADLQEFKQTKHYGAIRTYLDINELMAIAVAKKVFSNGVCYAFWCNTLKTLIEETPRIVEDARAEHNGEKRYDGLVALRKRWS